MSSQQLLPEVSEVRRRILNVNDEALRRCLATLYLFGARVSEVVGLASPGDRHGRGYTVDVGQGEMMNRARGVTGKSIGRDDFEGKEVLLFDLQTAKRKGMVREIGLPPDFEPWARTLWNYWKAAGEAPVFAFTRQYVHQQVAALGVFDGLTYRVEQYVRTGDRRGLKGTTTETVGTHDRPLTLHGLRHLRARELRVYYRFTPEERAAYLGWSVGRVSGVPTSGTYDTPLWYDYFPKLCKVRPT